MAALRHFTFPQPNCLDSDDESDSETQSPTLNTKSRPRIQLQTTSKGPPDSESAFRLAVPASRYPRTEHDSANMSPPDTPSKIRLSTNATGSAGSDMTRSHDTETPPATPIWQSHSKTSSASSIANSLSSLRRGDSTSSHTSRGRRQGTSIEESFEIESVEVGSRGLTTFPYWISDYEIKSEDKKKPLGSGLWSDVYLATPCLPALSSPTSVPANLFSGPTAMPLLTPPITPIKSRTSSVSKHNIPSLPRAYAIKYPASKSSKAVLGAEALVLSYLSRFPDSETYVVPFYGQDMRTEALVLEAMDTTLETFTQTDLNSLGEAARAKKLKDTFPALAKHLTCGLDWLGSKGVVHADIKPGNILLSTSPSTPPRAVYSDFSSSILISSSSTPPATNAPLGGGTWDYLDPLLLSSSAPTTPSAPSDLWSLAITLLTIVIGASPFDCAGNNVFRRREMVKHGTPLAYVYYGDEGPLNVKRLGGLGERWKVWFEMVLTKDAGKRCDVQTWREELEKIA